MSTKPPVDIIMVILNTCNRQKKRVKAIINKICQTMVDGKIR